MDEFASEPTQVGTDTDWTDVAAGGQHTVAIKADGSIWAWGSMGYGGNEMAGEDPGLRFEETPEWQSVAIAEPTQVGADMDWAQVAAGEHHIVAIKSDGSLWAWGDNRFYQLDDGEANPVWRERFSTEPTQIGTDTDWTDVAATRTHSLAIKADGSLWGCGYNEIGQIGSNSGCSFPTRIGEDTDWTSLPDGIINAVAEKDDGTLWVWGYFYYVDDDIVFRAHDRVTPLHIKIGTDWANAAAGGDNPFDSSLAISIDGKLWAWKELQNFQKYTLDEWDMFPH